MELESQMIMDGGSLRASNTQPALVVRCESESKSGLEKQKKNVLNQLNKVDYNFDQKIFG